MWTWFQRGFLLFVVTSSLTSSLRGQLHWQKTFVDISAAVGQQKIEVVFPYVNDGKLPVRIRDVEASCGCMVSTYKKEFIEPGERGAITLQMSFDGRSGRLLGRLKVETDLGTQTHQELSVSVNVPVAVVIHPMRVSWSIGDRNLAKSVLVSVAEPELNKIESIVSIGKTFEATLEPEISNGSRIVVIRARDTRRATTGLIRLRLVSATGISEHLIYAAVK